MEGIQPWWLGWDPAADASLAVPMGSIYLSIYNGRSKSIGRWLTMQSQHDAKMQAFVLFWRCVLSVFHVYLGPILIHSAVCAACYGVCI